MADDARSLSNTALLETSFLYGANATFVEEMAARYARDPNSVDASWRAFFDQVRDDPAAVTAAVKGPSWYRPEIARPQTTETTALPDGGCSALAAKLEQVPLHVRWARTGDGLSNWVARDSVRALMMIRAYRNWRPSRSGTSIRVSVSKRLPVGAWFDPSASARLRPSDGGSPDLHRRRARSADAITANEMLVIRSEPIARPSGVEFMHISRSGREKQERIEGPDKGVAFTPEGKRSILKKLYRGRGLREVRAQAPSWHQALRSRWRRSDDPGDGTGHQARRRARC
ncbi:MAG: hypothetical protein R3C27_10460 [Hyphomonadaceae bacterium]